MVGDRADSRPASPHARPERLAWLGTAAARASALGVRLPGKSADAAPVRRSVALDSEALASSEHALDGWRLQLDCVPVGSEGARIDLAVENTSADGRVLHSVFIDLVATGLASGDAPIRFLRHGWQSWSLCEVAPLTAEGDAEFPSGPWLRGMHHAAQALPADRPGRHESHTLTVVGASAPGAPVLGAGILEAGESFGLVHVAGDASDALRLEAEWLVEARFGPGERRQLEPLFLVLGSDAGALLERIAALWGHRGGARTDAPFQAGWCSWYHFFHAVTEDDLRRNLTALAEDRTGIPVDVVQLDDGYQKAIGDWLETNAKFPSTLEEIAGAIRDAGYRPGLWIAPFAVVPESDVHAAHPDWLLRDREGNPVRGTLNPAWAKEGWCHVLDASHPEVQAHLEHVHQTLAAAGFTYQKLDFLYMTALHGEAHDPTLSRAARLRAGLDAIRRGVGEDVFLLGCGSPLGPAVGVVDGMRIGPDVAPSWSCAFESAIPGLEPAMPATKSAVRSILNRAFQHRRLWLNDPDCLMTRSAETDLTPTEAATLAAAVAVTGGMGIVSDDVPLLGARERALLRETLETARRVDASAPWGTARVLNLLSDETPRRVVAQRGPDALIALINESDAPCAPTFDSLPDAAEHAPSSSPGSLHGEAAGPHGPPRSAGLPGRVREDACRKAIATAWAEGAGGGPASKEGRASKEEEDTVSRQLDAHASALVRVPADRSIAVFCDFDGTFAVQDVGASIGELVQGERRPGLWERLKSGEFTAWEYACALLDGIEYPERDLDAFLETIDIDPGAQRLMDWCKTVGAPFRILSDGFDKNLDKLMALNGIEFEYDANHLIYRGDRWELRPGRPNPDCECGTGSCKRGLIDAYREENPDAYCVHIGNGRVSDLCGALAADLAFAKQTLAEELEERGIAYLPFETLLDVVDALSARVDRSDAADADEERRDA